MTFILFITESCISVQSPWHFQSVEGKKKEAYNEFLSCATKRRRDSLESEIFLLLQRTVTLPENALLNLSLLVWSQIALNTEPQEHLITLLWCGNDRALRRGGDPTFRRLSEQEAIKTKLEKRRRKKKTQPSPSERVYADRTQLDRSAQMQSCLCLDTSGAALSLKTW